MARSVRRKGINSELIVQLMRFEWHQTALGYPA